MGPVGFDLDMTLIDSRPAIMAAFAELAIQTATAIDLTAVDSRLGIKLEDEVAFWFPPDQQAAATACYRRHYVRLAPRLTTIMPGCAPSRRMSCSHICRISRSRPTKGEPSATWTGEALRSWAWP